MRRVDWRFAWLLVVSLALCSCHGRGGESSAPQSALGGASGAAGPTKTFRLTPSGGIGFDDLLFSSDMNAVLAPAGGTGCVELFESSSLTRTSLCGVGPGGTYTGGHGEGTTSADAGAGFVFAIDRSSQSLQLIAPKPKRVVATARLAGGPDYVRWVASKREIWVTEPDKEQIEVFTLTSDGPPQVARAGGIAIKGGPESLVIDPAHGRAFTHLWQGRTVQVSIEGRDVSKSFENGCTGSRGIALDATRGQLYVGCSEGKAVVLDVDHGKKILDSETTSGGVDIIAVNTQLHHFYLPASEDGSVAVLGVNSRGKLSRLGVFQATKGTHCAASDDRNRVWVCSPDSGSLLVFDDPFPSVME
jgi:hypothetical protein